MRKRKTDGMNFRYKQRVAAFIANEVLAQDEMEPINDEYAEVQEDKRKTIKMNEYLHDHK